uniref:glycosyltransferase n=1 Tax=Cephaloticoccus sp. TaxID=1985742 RepID=UPI004049DF10
MQETATNYFQLESPEPGARVTGPVVWLRGWLVGKPNYDFIDVRVHASNGVHRGVHGIPRVDLATFFQSNRSWLPAAFVVAVPLPAGPADLQIEGKDSYGNWHSLSRFSYEIVPDGIVTQALGKIIECAGGSETVITPHLPFHGHLESPREHEQIHQVSTMVDGWLLHDSQQIRKVFATTDGQNFNSIDSGMVDETLAAKITHHRNARHARISGRVDTPVTLIAPCYLKVYATLADGSIHLCFARRLAPRSGEPQILVPPSPPPVAVLSKLPQLPTGRPRRLLLFVRSLQPEDETLRALDIVGYFITEKKWCARIVAVEDGPLHNEFEAAGCPVQIVNPFNYFAATTPTATAHALGQLGREILWSHLHVVALFDGQNTWAPEWAKRQGIPVFTDPAEHVGWFAPQFENQLPTVKIEALTPPRINVVNLRDTRENTLLNHPIDDSSIASFASGLVCAKSERHPHRLLLSAMAMGVPLITTPSPLLQTSFCTNELTFIAPGNPLAQTHAMIDTLTNPNASARRARAARRIALSKHAPSTQLPRWQKLMESVVLR